MNFITKTLNKLFKSTNQQELNKIKPIVVKINDLEKDFLNLSEEGFIQKTQQLKKNISEGRNLNEILPEAFALVREAAKQTLNERHFDVQLVGGVVLHRGSIAEMKTGEGKTLVSTLPAYLNALKGKGVHIVTVNDYLAKRDSEWMGKIYNRLGLKRGKSLSTSINHLIKIRLEEKGWKSESKIFKSGSYKHPWRLDFTKGKFSVEVAFNHGEATAWNLMKPVIASEINHVDKEIQTEIGIVVFATSEMKRSGGFDGTVKTFEDFELINYEHHPKIVAPMND